MSPLLNNKDLPTFASIEEWQEYWERMSRTLGLVLRPASPNPRERLVEMAAVCGSDRIDLPLADRAKKGKELVEALVEVRRRKSSSITLQDDEAAKQAVSAGLIAELWFRLGCPRYVLSDSVAAMLTLTKSPSLDVSILPFSAFVIEVPSRFIPPDPECHGSSTTFLVGRWAGVFVVCVVTWGLTQVLVSLSDRLVEGTQEDDARGTMFSRIVSNTTHYISAYRECLRPRTGPRGGAISPVLDVTVPQDVVVSRAMRDYAAGLAAAGTLSEAKNVLRHVVRGHWKQQVHGAGRSERRLLWIQPYQRGDDDLGRIVERVEHIVKPPGEER